MLNFLFSFKILNMYFCRRINSYIFINFYSIHILLFDILYKGQHLRVISMENYQQFLDSPNTFVLIAFILYLICAFVFFTVTVFIGLRHVSYRKNNYYIGFDNYSYIDFNWTYILYRFKIRQIKNWKASIK